MRRVVYDFETTGNGRHSTIAIVQVGALRLAADGTIESTFSEDVRPWRACDEEARKVHGLTEARLQKARPWRDVGRSWFEWMGGNEASLELELVGFQSNAFDAPILRYENERAGIANEAPPFVFGDWAPAIWGHLGRRASLVECHRINTTKESQSLAHDALGDCRLLLELVHGLQKQKGILLHPTYRIFPFLDISKIDPSRQNNVDVTEAYRQSHPRLPSSTRVWDVTEEYRRAHVDLERGTVVYKRIKVDGRHDLEFEWGGQTYRSREALAGRDDARKLAEARAHRWAASRQWMEVKRERARERKKDSTSGGRSTPLMSYSAIKRTLRHAFQDKR